jgi:MFS family permease
VTGIEQSSPPYPSRPYAWWVVTVLTIAYILSFIDRQVISLMVVPIRRDLGISDTQVSLLIGLAFSIFYTLMGIPIARLADRYSRRAIITVGIVGWCVMTAACGLARTFWQLFLARMGVGVGEAALSPAAQSMITDYFPKERLGRALGVYHTGIAVGMGIALMIGGGVVAALSGLPPLELPLVGTIRAWQLTFILVGLPGLLVALLMWTVKEPLRRGVARSEVSDGDSAPDASEGRSFLDVLSFMRGHWRAYGAVFLGQAMIITMGFGFAAWVPTLFIRTYGWTAGEIGFAFGLVLSVFGVTGVTLGGWIVDALHKRDRSDAPLRTMLFGVLLFPVGCLAPLLPDPIWALALIGLMNIGGGIPSTAGAVALMTLTPNQMRAQVTALYMLANSLLGMTVGPTAIAVMTDYLFRDDYALRYSMALLVAVMMPVALGVIALGLRSYRASAAAARRWSEAPAAH